MCVCSQSTRPLSKRRRWGEEEEKLPVHLCLYSVYANAHHIPSSRRVALKIQYARLNPCEMHLLRIGMHCPGPIATGRHLQFHSNTNELEAGQFSNRTLCPRKNTRNPMNLQLHTPFRNHSLSIFHRVDVRGTRKKR